MNELVDSKVFVNVMANFPPTHHLRIDGADLHAYVSYKCQIIVMSRREQIIRSRELYFNIPSFAERRIYLNYIQIQVGKSQTDNLIWKMFNML